MIRLSAILLLILVVTASASGQDIRGDLGYSPPAIPAPPDIGGMLIKLAAMTGFVLAICFGIMWYVRKQSRAIGPNPGNRLFIAGSLTLNRRSVVHLVRVDGHTVAVTTDATGLKSLVLLSEPFDAELDAASRLSN
jgi:flagellar biogenesis protein FliO